MKAAIAAALCAAILIVLAPPLPAQQNTWEGLGPSGGSFLGAVTDPANADAVTAVTCYPSNAYVYRSSDGGGNWSKIGEIPYEYLNDMCAYGFSRLYVISSFGCYASADGGATWTYSLFPSDQGLGYCVCVHPNDPDTVFVGGYNWNGSGNAVLFKSVDGGATWTSSFITQKYFRPADMAVSQSNPDVMYICGYEQGSLNNFAALFKTSNGGLQWKDLSKFVDVYPYRYLYCIGVDPNDEDLVYTGGNYFYKSTDGGSNWTIDESYFFDAWGIGIDPVDTANLYLGGNGNVFVSTDFGDTWSIRPGAIAECGEHVEVAPAEPATIYVASPYGGLYQSTDSGSTWVAASNGIYTCDIAAMAVAPSRPETLFVNPLSSYQFIASHDSGGTWQELTYPLGCSGTMNDILVCSTDPDIVIALESG